MYDILLSNLTQPIPFFHKSATSCHGENLSPLLIYFFKSLVNLVNILLSTPLRAFQG